MDIFIIHFFFIPQIASYKGFSGQTVLQVQARVYGVDKCGAESGSRDRRDRTGNSGLLHFRSRRCAWEARGRAPASWHLGPSERTNKSDRFEANLTFCELKPKEPGPCCQGKSSSVRDACILGHARGLALRSIFWTKLWAANSERQKDSQDSHSLKVLDFLLGNDPEAFFFFLHLTSQLAWYPGTKLPQPSCMASGAHVGF